MKKLLCALLLLCGVGLSAENLLRDTPWRFIPAGGGAGNVAKSGEYGRKIFSTSPKGFVSFANSRALPVVPGKSYRVTAKVMRNDPAVKLQLLVSIGKRTPWASVNADGEVGKFQTLTYDFTAKEGETGMRVHFIVSGTGSADVADAVLDVQGGDTAAAVEPAAPPADLLGGAPWRFVTADGGKGRQVKNADGSYTIHTDSPKGFVSFANSRTLPIEPGKHYQVKAVVTRDNAAAKAHMLVSVGNRKPWAKVNADGVACEKDELVYDFTAKKGETGMRVHLIVSGSGKVAVSSVTRQGFSDAQLRALNENTTVTATKFTGNALKKAWKPFLMRGRAAGSGISFISNPFGGIECSKLDWDASKIKSIDIRMASSEPGYIYLEFVTSAGQKSYLSQAAYPGRPLRDYTFNVATNPAWKGKITSVRIIWRAYERVSHLEFAGVIANSKANIIPFAADKKGVEKLELISFLPRAEYKLTFEGKNPGTTLKFFDRLGRKLSTYTLAAGKENGTFTAPEMVVRAELAMKKGSSAIPCIEMLNWSKPDKKDFDWRGKWIWSNTEFGPANEYVWFKRDFEVSGKVQDAEVIFTADDKFIAYINGHEVCSGDNWRTPVRANAAKFIKPGKNSIVIRTFNESAWGGLIGELYVNAGDQVRFYPTDSSWQYYIGGKNPPAKYTAAALELGAPPTSPWGDLVYQYVGPKARVTVKKAGVSSAVIRVSEAVPVNSSKLMFDLKFPDGTVRKVSGGVTPATGKWQPGRDIQLKIDLPPVTVKGVTAEFASDFIASGGTVCSLKAVDSGKRKLTSAKVVGTGKRAYFVINGEKYPPIYYDGYNKIENSWMMDKAKLGGCKIVRIGCSIHLMWKSENEFDFSLVDRYMDMFAVNYPDAKIILQVKVTMPDWWLAKYPDDVVAYHDGRPYSKAHDRHALSSRRWLKDGSYALRQLIRHLKKSPNADRIFTIGLSEGWNSEWFWSTLGGATSGYSKGDLATFRAYLKESYRTDAALAKAWNMPQVTFDTVKMPMPAEIDRASCGELMDPVLDQRIIDYFRYRNRALGDAIETFGKVVKEESDNRYLVGVYYGYFVMFSHINRKLQTVGHLDIERLARSPYVDLFWAPSLYHWRQIGMPDGIMQASETLTAHGKLVVVEQDMRTFSEPSHMQAGNGRTNNPDQTINAMYRALGLLLARGVGTHWYDMHEIWFREKVLLEAMKDINETYMSLPAVAGTTPVEVCFVSDQESAFYTRHNFKTNPNKGTVYELLRTFNYAGIPFRHVFVNDLLEKGRVPAAKLYIFTSVVMLNPDKYAKLMERFAREKASVLHLYATGVTRPGKTPSAENMAELLGMKFRMDKTFAAPVSIPANGKGRHHSPAASRPWFYPVSGFDKVLASGADKRPVMVQKKVGKVDVYFSTLMKPSLEMLSDIARRAGVHVYATDNRNAMHIGNDTLFLLPSHDGKVRINLPAGKKLYGIIGEYKGKVFANGEDIPVRNGTYAGFAVK